MEDTTFTIELKCLFCDVVLQGDTDIELSSGDMIECQECNEKNDYDSLIQIAKEEGVEKVSKQTKSEIEKILKKAFK